MITKKLSERKMLNKYLIGAIAWALVILVLTMTPGKSVPDIELLSYDKLGHAFVFLVLSFLLITGLFVKDNRTRSSIIIGLIFVSVYGFCIEVAQGFIPDRAMDVYDAIANVIGSFLGLALFYIRIKLKA